MTTSTTPKPNESKELDFVATIHAESQAAITNLTQDRDEAIERADQLSDALIKSQAEVEQLRATWRCFHCGFESSDTRDAEAHFGERDDAEEFTPTCKWWQRMGLDERVVEFQDLLKELNLEREDNANLSNELDKIKSKLCNTHKNDLPHCSGCVICGLQKTAQERNALQIKLNKKD